jgi:hypothetical protein
MDSTLKLLGLAGYNKPKLTPSHPKKKAVVVAKLGSATKTIRFGEQGAPSNYSASARERYKARHAKDLKGNILTAGYWANKFLWMPDSPVIK